MGVGLVLERKLKRIFKVLKGSYFTFTGKGKIWEGDYWDSVFYTEGVSDAKTISSKKNEFSAGHHYASVEMHLLRHFVNFRVPRMGRVLDIGSGAGHWIDFYKRWGAEQVTGIEVSEKCAAYLNEKYAADNSIEIYVGNTAEVLQQQNLDEFDLISAIGVLFHIVDDRELLDVLRLFSEQLNPGGYLIVGGNFGHWPFNINTQVKFGNIINKRLRSRYWWKKQLKKLGFKNIRIQYNTAYAFINDRTPENSLLICQR